MKRTSSKVTPEMKQVKAILQVKSILMKHKGKKHSISSGEIAELLGMTDGDTHSQVRKLIKQCAYVYRIPLAGNSNGYYVITKQKELDEYCENLETRVRQINQRKRTMQKFFQEKYG